MGTAHRVEGRPVLYMEPPSAIFHLCGKACRHNAHISDCCGKSGAQWAGPTKCSAQPLRGVSEGLQLVSPKRTVERGIPSREDPALRLGVNQRPLLSSATGFQTRLWWPTVVGTHCPSELPAWPEPDLQMTAQGDHIVCLPETSSPKMLPPVTVWGMGC